MNRTRMGIHAGLAAIGVALAFITWTDDSPERGESEVLLFACDADEVSELSFSDDGHEVRLRVSREGERPAYSLSTERTAEGAEEPVRRQFVGSDDVGEFIDALMPLYARRGLGTLSDEQLAEVGLDEPSGHLAVTCAGEERRYELGERSFGLGDRYARAVGGGPALLLAADRLQPLGAAEQRLMQRALHRTELREVSRMTVEAFGRELVLLHRNRFDPESAEWVDASQPGRRNELFGNWLSRYPRLTAQRYLADGEEPGADLEDERGAAGEDVVTITLADEGGAELGRMQLHRVAASPPAYYARTETTLGWVRVPGSGAAGFEEDLRLVFGVEPREEPAAEAASGEAASGEAASGEAASGEAASGEAASGEAASGEAASGEAASGEAASGEAAPGEAASGEAASGEAASGEAASGEAASGEAPPGSSAGPAPSAGAAPGSAP